MSEFYKENHFYRKKSSDYENMVYGQIVDSKGDLIFNTLSKIIDDNDTSEWARLAFMMCGGLLECRMRWPHCMNQPNDSKNWIQWRWSQALRRLNIRKTEMYRPQKSITRDPFYPFFYLCIKFGRKDLIKEVTLPFYLYRREIWRWRRRLIKDNSPDYVKRLRYYRNKANVLNYETT